MKRRLLVALLGVSAACGGPGDDDLVVVTRQDLPINVEAIGSLRAVDNTTISPPTIPNVWRFKIASMATESSEVKEGDLILSFDPSEMQQELERKTAERDQAAKEIEKKTFELDAHYLDLDRQVAEARARLRKAQMKVDVPAEFQERLELEKARLELREAKAETDSLTAQRRHAEESGKSQIETLEHRRERADQRVRQLQEGLQKMSMMAPRDGLVIQIENWRGEKKKIGDTVTRFDEVLQIPDLGRMEALVEIDEADAGRVALGQSATVRLETHPDVEYSGTVAEIAPTVRRQSWRSPLKVYEVLLELERTDTDTMRPGMRLRAEIEVDRIPEALVIPLEAVLPRSTGAVVLTRRADGLAEVPVELGARNQTMVEVRGGLEEGRWIARRAAQAAARGTS